MREMAPIGEMAPGAISRMMTVPRDNTWCPGIAFSFRLEVNIGKV